MLVIYKLHVLNYKEHSEFNCSKNLFVLKNE